ncbi:TspO/MBR family protein [Erythrobacter sp. T5W1-R]|uniref:TspO/MBR family protein n=1 Tax=Erythrobacter sp. T5W1-R TaxID=3101752 RepID=UPI002AFEA5B3|nr:TspO/MBR family protein [Erythrobacter sp. T5W1-R]MEA1617378.1 TspO/MBR family protein [Erythrobacter sp. T5W1-R]
MIDSVPHRVMPQYPKFVWWHAAVFLLVVNIPGSLVGFRDELYPGYRVPPLRPPAELFPFIWLGINICTLWAGLRILNNRNLNRRPIHIGLQAAFWLDFAIFPYFFFGQSSPVLGGLLTMLIFVVAAAECALLWRDDRKAAYLMMPLVAWGAFAGLYASTWQMFFNADPYLGTAALLG